MHSRTCTCMKSEGKAAARMEFIWLPSLIPRPVGTGTEGLEMRLLQVYGYSICVPQSFIVLENHSPWTSLIFKYARKWISLTCALAVAGMLHHHSQALLLNHGTGHWLKIEPVLCLCVRHEGSNHDHIIYSHQVNQGIKLVIWQLV